MKMGSIWFGAGLVPWADAVRDDSGEITYPAGWVLPGGERTIVRERAEAVAHEIDRLTKERNGHAFAPNPGQA